MYAYRSEDGSAAVEIQSLQNNCNSLIAPFESYGGIVTEEVHLLAMIAGHRGNMIHLCGK
jgi:hypothetical protein